MDRQTLDMEGARQGELSAASLQLGNDTIAIQRIATMSVEQQMFAPWDTPRNRQTQRIYATTFVGCLFFALVGLAWWQFAPAYGTKMTALSIGGILFLLSMFLGLRAAVIAWMLNKQEPYYRLTIGTSDSRQIPVVDNNRAVLIKIRDAVRHKMDTGDLEVVGDFDLNLDIVNLRGMKAVTEARATAAPPAPAHEQLFDEELPAVVKSASS